MSHGRISQTRQRYPDAQRRASRYGATRFGRRGRPLAPHLMPGITSRESKSKFLGGPLGILAILGVFAGVFAFIFVVVTIISTIAGIAGTKAAYKSANDGLPNAAGVAVNSFQTTRIYDRNGNLLQELENPDKGWRTFISMVQMPQEFIDATVSAEDSTFWTNEGVDPFAIARGVVINISGAGSSGGSTITQQLVRALYPSQISALDISYTRKGREALVAYSLNKDYSKTDIFTMYVNEIYYGNRSYGIEAAAQSYFNVHAVDLTLAQSAYLAGMPQSPSFFFENPDQAKIRQKYVLDQMVKYRYITRDQADDAYREPIEISNDRSSEVKAAPHFTEYVRQYILQNYGDEALYGGLQITTSIDLDLQARAQQIVTSGVAELADIRRNNGAMVVMAPWSGEVLAMVGSADFSNSLINGEVNYATAQIQPGSSMKPLVYAAAFEKGLNPGSVLMDIPSTWEVPGQEDYTPQNYNGSFNGAVSIRTALANSFNIPAVKATEFVGVQGVMDTARRMGLVNSLEQDAGYYGLSIGLGGAEVQLVEHTNAYATLSNNGTYVPVHPIIKIEDSQGNVLYNLDKEQIAKESSQAVPAGNAYQVTSILTDNQARARVFTTDNLFGRTQEELGRPTAAKSGTTNDWKDLWTMGYTTDVAIGVWVGVSGGASKENLPEKDGISTAGPIWAQMMVEMHQNPKFSQLLVGPDGTALPEKFPVPDDVYQGEVCSVTGHEPGRGETKEEWLVRGQEPSQACGELDTRERDELNKAIAATKKGGVKWSGDALDSIAEYASVAGVDGAVQPEDNSDDSDNSGNSDSNNSTNSGNGQESVPIEPVGTETPPGDATEMPPG